jgi:hypothetical protein
MRAFRNLMVAEAIMLSLLLMEIISIKFIEQISWGDNSPDITIEMTKKEKKYF